MYPTKLIRCLLFLLGLAGQVSAQSYMTARTVGTGGAGVAMTGTEALFSNPAAPDTNHGHSFIGTSSMPFVLPGLTFAAIGTKLSMGRNQHVHGSIGSFGIKKYRRSAVTIGYSRSILSNLRIASEVSVGSEYFEGYSNSLRMDYGIFIFQQITEHLNFGISLRNIIPVQLGIKGIPFFSAGLSYRISENMDLYVDISKMHEGRLRLKAGTEYYFTERLTLRAGIATKPSTFHLGASMKWKRKVCFTMGTHYHVVLGLSPSFDITFVP